MAAITLGTSIILSDSQEDVVWKHILQNNDAAMVGDAVNLKTLNNVEDIIGINLTTNPGMDMQLSNYIEVVEQLDKLFSLEGKEIANLRFNHIDSGQSLYQYEVSVLIIYEEEIEVDTYEEAQKKSVKAEALAKEKTAQSNVNDYL